MPAAQAAQVRFVLVSPSAVTYVPTTHCVLATHGVPALPSSSHVLAGHAVGVTVPPGQNVPASHEVHAVFCPLLAGEVW